MVPLLTVGLGAMSKILITGARRSIISGNHWPEKLCS
jgi:hypothetical protein